jgi:2'-5' RNA ligase
MRLFVGIPLPETLRDRLGFLCSGLPNAKWVDPDSMHLTLRFIGEVSGADAEDIHVALSAINAPAFDVTVSGIGCFESGGKVRAIWAGVEKEPRLIHLRDKIESALVRIGVEPERRKFKPHITLARFRNQGTDRIGRFIERNNHFSGGVFSVDHFVLFRSHLTSKGAYYDPLVDYPLAGSAHAVDVPAAVGL